MPAPANRRYWRKCSRDKCNRAARIGEELCYAHQKLSSRTIGRVWKYLYLNPHKKVRDVAVALGKSPATVMAAMQQLQEAGALERDPRCFNARKVPHPPITDNSGRCYRIEWLDL